MSYFDEPTSLISCGAQCNTYPLIVSTSDDLHIVFLSSKSLLYQQIKCSISPVHQYLSLVCGPYYVLQPDLTGLEDEITQNTSTGAL